MIIQINSSNDKNIKAERSASILKSLYNDHFTLEATSLQKNKKTNASPTLPLR